MLLAVYLDYLNSLFLIYRLLCKYSEAASHSLLSTSMQQLTAVIVLVKQHSVSQAMQRDYAWMVRLQFARCYVDS